MIRPVKYNFPYYLVLASIIPLYLITTLLITWDPFYESGNYINYLISFISDKDLNIINQSTDSPWIVSKSLYDISHHTPLQTPILLVISTLENISKLLITIPKELNYTFTSFLASYIFLILGFKFNNDILNLLKIKTNLIFPIVFVVGTSVFYFSFLRYNVLELFTFPLLSYLFRELIKAKLNIIKSGDTNLYFAVGICLCLKPAYFLFCIYVLCYFIWLQKSNKEYSKIFLGIFLLSTIIIIEKSFWIKKYNFLQNRFNQFSSLIDISPEQFLSKLFTAFEVKGFFAANPLFLSALVGLVFLIIKLKKSNTLSKVEIFVLISWVLGGISQNFFTIFAIWEDHLIGRLAITSLPLLYIGYVYFQSLIKRDPLRNFFNILGICIGTFSTLYYISDDINSHYSYAFSKNIDLDSLMKGLVNYKSLIAEKFQVIINNMPYFFLLFLLILLFQFISTKFKKPLRVKLFSYLFILSYLMVYGTHFIQVDSNIKQLKDEGFYLDKAIVHGLQIYGFPYTIDAHIYAHYSLKARGKSRSELKDSVNRALNYVTVIKKQIITPNQILLEKIQNFENHFNKEKLDLE